MSSSGNVSIRIAIDVPIGGDQKTHAARVEKSFTITSGVDPSVQLGPPTITISGGTITVTCSVTITGLVAPTKSAVVYVPPASPPTTPPTATLSGSTVSFSVPTNSPLVGASVVLAVFAFSPPDLAGDAVTITIPTPSPMKFCDPLPGAQSS